MSDSDGIIWPVTDTQIDKDELDAMDGISLGDPNLYSPASHSHSLSVGQNISIGASGGPYGSYVATQYVEQQIGDDGVDTVAIKGNLTISDEDGNNKIDVGDFMKTIQDRMLVLQPDFEAHEQYPALKDAYDQYKMLEKLLTESKNAKKD